MKSDIISFLQKGKILSLFILCLLVISCSKNEVPMCSNLYQTFWTGTLEIHYLEKKIKYEINIIFDSQNTGQYFIKKFTPEIPFSYKTDFKYNVESNIILIEGGFNNILTGQWWITYCEGNEVILKRNIENQANSDELYIIKKEQL